MGGSFSGLAVATSRVINSIRSSSAVRRGLGENCSVEIRSIETLDLPLAWRRILFRIRRFIDVPDRLPFEVLDRLTSGSPQLGADHHLRPITTVMATKGSGTVRPFVRISPSDLLLYQALVDAVAIDLEAALGSPSKVFAYRLDTTGAEDPFANTPKWSDFITSVREELATGQHTHALSGDIASYFVYIDIDELERRLLEACSDTTAVRDLGDLLRGFRQLGIRGLPQGVPPSSPLGNFYLSSLDRAFESWGVEFRRYMDDFWAFASSFQQARRIQDAVERLLYRDGLGLGGDKSRIRRVSTALDATETAQERIDARRAAIAEELLAGIDGDYIDIDEIELPEEEIDEAAVHGEYDELFGELQADQYPLDARSRLIEVYRTLEKGRDIYAMRDIPGILARMPDLTWPAVRYLAAIRGEHAEAAEDVMLELLHRERFHREQEWLHLCRAGLFFRRRPAVTLAERFGEVALNHEHPLVRARALLAWGRLSGSSDFAIAESFWASASSAWQPYVLVALQHKAAAQRNGRYQDWSGEGRFLRSLANAIQARPFPWREL
jgi:hypothetical protein